MSRSDRTRGRLRSAQRAAYATHHRLWGLSAVLLACQVAAQVVPPAADPGALQQQRMDEERRREDVLRLQRAPLTNPLKAEPAPAAPAAAAPDAVRFPVREIRFTPSDILSAQDLEERFNLDYHFKAIDRIFVRVFGE